MENKHKDGQRYMPTMLDLETVMEIAKRMEEGEKPVDLAKEYKVTKTIMSKIKRCYADIPIKNRKFFSKEFKASVVQEYVDGAMISELAEKHGVYYGMVWYWIKKANVELRDKFKKPKPEYLDRFIEMYQDSDKSVPEISRILEVPTGTLYGYVRRLKLKRNKIVTVLSDAQKNKIKKLHGNGYPMIDILKITGISRTLVKSYIKTL